MRNIKIAKTSDEFLQYIKENLEVDILDNKTKHKIVKLVFEEDTWFDFVKKIKQEFPELTEFQLGYILGHVKTFYIDHRYPLKEIIMAHFVILSTDPEEEYKYDKNV